MISERIRIADIDGRHWKNLIEIFRSARKFQMPSILFCMMRGSECLKAIHSQRGLMPDLPTGNFHSMEELAQYAGADYVAIVEEMFFQELFARSQAAIHYEDDYPEQLLSMINAGAEYSKNNIRWHPKRPYKIGALSLDKVKKAVKWAWRDNTCLAFILTDEDNLPYTSVILGKSEGRIDLFTTLLAFDLHERPFPLRTGMLTLNRLCSKRYYPISIGITMHLATFYEMKAAKRMLTFFDVSQTRERALLWPAPRLVRIAMWLGKFFGL